MKEILDILEAYATIRAEGRKAALATVVRVEGSSYRQPGARMLIGDDGSLAGAISGGCLEADAMRKAMLAIAREQSMLITYDTMDDNSVLGVGLGCNGIIHILIEPVNEADPANPLEMMRKSVEHRKALAMITFFKMDYPGKQAGTCLLMDKSKIITGVLPGQIDPARLQMAVRQAFEQQSSVMLSDCLVDLLKPPIHLVIAGAGNDVIPLVEMAHQLAWHITVLDGRPLYATCPRFPQANEVLVSDAREALSKILVDQQTAVVLMTHNYNYDLAVLRQLKKHKVPYIGILGPKKKCDRLLGELGTQEQRPGNIYGPVGLDIGAETSEEIALAILAEIKAVFAGRTGKPLRDKTSAIHKRLSGENNYITSIGITIHD
jgi:xanthine dehydrogenase accessory factor